MGRIGVADSSTFIASSIANHRADEAWRMRAVVAATGLSTQGGDFPALLALEDHLRDREIRILEDERRRIARDLHDEAGHRLAAAMLRLDAVASEWADTLRLHCELQGVRQLLEECSDGLHEV